jgi:hypothetical protein
MTETVDLNDSTESLFTFVSFVERKIAVRVANVCVGECMFRENLTGGMSMSVFGIATSSCAILYSITRCASVLRSARQ